MIVKIDEYTKLGDYGENIKTTRECDNCSKDLSYKEYYDVSQHDTSKDGGLISRNIDLCSKDCIAEDMLNNFSVAGNKTVSYKVEEDFCLVE